MHTYPIGESPLQPVTNNIEKLKPNAYQVRVPFKGVNLYAISKRLGHSNMTITAKTYAYMLDEYKAQQDDIIE